MTGYYVWIVGPLLMTVATVISDLFRSSYWYLKRLSMVVVLLLSMSFLVSDVNVVLGVSVPQVLERASSLEPIVACGRSRRDSGVKAAAWWVRQNMPYNITVFCDANGDGWLDFPVCAYYLHRSVLGGYGRVVMRLEENYDLLAQNIETVDVLFVEPENAGQLADIPSIEMFDRVAEVRWQGRVTLWIYVRETDVEPVALDVEEFNALYDAVYADWEHVTAWDFRPVRTRE